MQIKYAQFYEDEKSSSIEYPSYEKIWDFILSNPDKIDIIVSSYAIFEFGIESLSSPNVNNRLPGKFIVLKKSDQLDNKSLDNIYTMCFAGNGNLSVFFQSKSRSLLNRLCILFPVSVVIEEDDALLKEKELRDVKKYVDSLSPDSFAFSFMHDGEPMCIFGSDRLLNEIIEKIMQKNV